MSSTDVAQLPMKSCDLRKKEEGEEEWELEGEDENRSSVHGDDRVCGGGCVYERGGGESGEEVEEKEEDAVKP